MFSVEENWFLVTSNIFLFLTFNDIPPFSFSHHSYKQC